MRDDTGKHVRVLNPNGFAEWPVKGDRRMTVLVQRVGQALRGNRWYVQLAHDLVSVALGLCVLVVTLWMLRTLGAGLPGWVTPTVIFAALFVTGRVAYQLRVGRSSWHAAGVILEEGLCPSCGYNLHGIDRDANERVVCPECGAAWNATRIIRAEPFAREAEYGVPLRAVWGATKRGPRWPTHDDRERVVPLVHPCLRKVIRAADPAYAPLLRDAGREIARQSRWVRWPFVALVWGCALGLPVLWLHIGVPASGAALWAVIFTGLALCATYGNFLYSARVTREALVKRRMCASCAWPLHGLPQDADGMTTCRNCRAAWSVEDAAGGGGSPE